MRAIAAGLLAAGLFSVGIANADQCAKPPEVSAFDVVGLKSQLMVTALTCSKQDRYNDFVRRFQSDLQSHERALKSYFARSFGRRAQQEQDDYITSLANTQSHNGLRQGTLFCQQNIGVFEEVMALPKGASLASFATSKSPAQPMQVLACTEPTRTAQAGTTRH